MKITNRDDNFYRIMGPVFGSRKIQRETGDRFYDDDEKEWFVDLDDSENVISVISVMDGVIKNIYSADAESLEILLREIYPAAGTSVVPAVYKDIYASVGYSVEDGKYKNFVNIKGGGASESDAE